ncbi:UNVERIFIED_CONTAM: UDP-glucosyltransferase 29 [Sesamum angustifolium]|uniref:UDP-glucosyltransferase 29 n=1 Tax=Sesamum angustifolium TaxID=2727405 RepID=A0AAW2LD75_9LAMI
MERKIVPVGPLVSADPSPDDGNSDLMEWLGKQGEFSTIFVSFGSENFLKREEIEEIAYALEALSNVNFIWVVRFPGVEEKGFRTNCLEGFLRGRKKEFDQPVNAKLVVEMGVGVEVDRDERGRFTREEIGKVIKDVVVSKIGQELRRKVWEKRELLRANGEEEIDGLVQDVAQLCGKSSVEGAPSIKN